MAFDRETRPAAGADAGAGSAAATPGKRTQIEAAHAGMRSSRFAGDPILEACYADRARLTVGEHGASVVKVQQALIDLGYLGAAADGDYGAATWNAIKVFKTREHLGWESMGDVGPGTMHRLDDLFGDTPPPTPTPADGADRASDDDHLSASDFVITSDTDGGPPIPAGLDESAIQQMMLTRQDPELDVDVDGASPQIAQQPAGGHVSIADAMARFKSKVDVANPAEPGTNVTDKGQFFWGRQLGLQVKADIDALRADPTAAAFCAKADLAWSEAMSFGDAGAALAAAQQAAVASKSPARARMLALVHGFTGGGAGLEALMWQALDKRADNTMPDLAQFRSLVTLHTLRKFDKVACTVQMLRTAERVKHKGGITARDPKVGAFFAGLNTGTGFRDQSPVGGDKLLGDVVVQTGVSGAVAGLRKALDAGLMVHARLLSGVGIGSTSVSPDPKAKRTPIAMPSDGEHSVLIIGYDNDQFVFSDPDASVSKNPGGGFGLLIFADGRLSTAVSDADLAVDANGDHGRGDHRYQVLFLQSV